MKRLLRMICMAGILLTFTQCATHGTEPMPEPVQEIWTLTYNDYRVLKNSCQWILYWKPVYQRIRVPEEYIDHHTRSLTVVKEGDKVTIKGMFPEYPEAMVKGMIRNDTLKFEATQVLEGTNGQTVYFHSGIAEFKKVHDSTTVDFQMTFTPDARSVFPIYGKDEVVDFDDMHWSQPYRLKYSEGVSFWISNDENEDSSVEFNTKWRDGRINGTGFPESEKHMVNMVFRKIREVPTESEVDDNTETE